MNPRDIFKVIVASFGLYVVYLGGSDLLSGVLYTLRLMDSTPYTPEGSNKLFALRGVIEIILGVLWLSGFFPFVKLVFPEQTNDDREDEAQEHQH